MDTVAHPDVVASLVVLPVVPDRLERAGDDVLPALFGRTVPGKRIVCPSAITVYAGSRRRIWKPAM